jgi:hypothetical protein
LFVQATQSNAHQMQIVSQSNNVQYFVESKQKEAPIKLAPHHKVKGANNYSYLLPVIVFGMTFSKIGTMCSLVGLNINESSFFITHCI